MYVRTVTDCNRHL